MNWFRNLNAQPRLGLGFSVVLLLALGMGYMGIANLYQANERMIGLYADMQTITALENLAVDKADKSKQDRQALLDINDPVAVEKSIKAGQDDITAMQKEMDKAEPFLNTDRAKTLLAQIRETLPGYQKAYEQAIKSLRAQDIDGVKASKSVMDAAAAPMMEHINELREHEQQLADQNAQANKAAYVSARNLMIGAAVLALLLGSILAFAIARGFSVPLTKAVAALERVAHGDLTAELDVHSRDEIGRMAAALNTAVQGLNTTMKQVFASASETTSSAHQLSAASEAISSGAQEQAASLEETSASLEQITGTAHNTADNARQASQLASASATSAQEGREVVAKAIAAMAEIDASSKKISDIISTIDEIAFQTNLLAVNAAVEAARAGEEGRGFAVVASEVRSLAQRSAVAAKEIKGLIQDSVRKVEAGSSLVNRSGETLQGIITSVKRVTDIVSEIAAASAEQSSGIEQVNKAMTQMDQVTQSNSAQTEELSATAESLSDQAVQLLELINRFRLEAVDQPRHSKHPGKARSTFGVLAPAN